MHGGRRASPMHQQGHYGEYSEYHHGNTPFPAHSLDGIHH